MNLIGAFDRVPRKRDLPCVDTAVKRGRLNAGSTMPFDRSRSGILQRQGLLLVTMEAPAELEEEFNDWYDTEHFPQRAGLPGFLNASRWVCLSGWPRWLALYDLDTVAAVDTPAYNAVSGTNATPWSKRILPRTIGRQRIVAEALAPFAAADIPQHVSRLLLARYHTTQPDRVEPAYREIAGLVQLRFFAAEPDELWAIAAFDRPVGMDRLAGAVGHVDGLSADFFNLYAPYIPR